MDWLGTSGEAGHAVDLALVKVEASVPVTDASYGGAVVLNPGKSTLNTSSGYFLQVGSLRRTTIDDQVQADQGDQEFSKCLKVVMLFKQFFRQGLTLTRARQTIQGGITRSPLSRLAYILTNLLVLRHYRI